MASLRDISFVHLVDKKEVGKLLFLYNSNMLVQKQKNIVLSKMLTDSYFIINAVENHSDMLNNFKYGIDIIYLYGLITDVDKYKTFDYIKNMVNFNENDSAFLWYILHWLLYGDNLTDPYRGYVRPPHFSPTDDHRDFIFSNFRLTTMLQKMIGFIRIDELGLDKTKYTDAWDASWSHNGDCTTIINKVGRRGEKHRDSYGSIYNSDPFEIKFTSDYNFKIFKIRNIRKNIAWDETSINGNLFKYNDDYYVGKYNEETYFKNNNVDFNVDIGKDLTGVLPYIKGDVSIMNFYNGVIIDGKYVMKNVYKRKPNISYWDLRHIIEKIVR